MTFEQFKTLLLTTFGTLVLTIATFMAHSIWSLNEKLAVLVEHVTYQDRDISQIRKDVDRIKDQLDRK